MGRCTNPVLLELGSISAFTSTPEGGTLQVPVRNRGRPPLAEPHTEGGSCRGERPLCCAWRHQGNGELVPKSPKPQIQGSGRVRGAGAGNRCVAVLAARLRWRSSELGHCGKVRQHQYRLFLDEGSQLLKGL